MAVDREAFNEYMRVSQQLHEESVAYMGSLTESEFLAHLIRVINGGGRSAMIVAAIRESVSERWEAIDLR